MSTNATALPPIGHLQPPSQASHNVFSSAPLLPSIKTLSPTMSAQETSPDIASVDSGVPPPIPSAQPTRSRRRIQARVLQLQQSQRSQESQISIPQPAAEEP